MRLTILICLFLKLIWSCEAAKACTSCPNSATLELKNCSLNATMAQMLVNCSGVEVLHTELVVLPTVHLSGQLKVLKVESCNTTAVIIDPTGSYKMEKFTVEKNNLRTLPRNLNVLKKLRKLILASNLIECIDMGEFIGLSNLEEINLSDNRIIQICSSPFDPPVLPNLDRVYLQRNNLTLLNLENWKTPNVKLMYLNNNELSIVHKLASSLPKLESLYIYGNPLNCEWWETLRAEIENPCTFSPNNQETCLEKAEPLKNLINQIEASSKIPSTSTDQCHLNSSKSLKQIKSQVLQLQQQVASLGGTPSGHHPTNETIVQLQQSCLGQQGRLREIVHEMGSPSRTNLKPRTDCRCGLKAQARLFQRQLEQQMAMFGGMFRGMV
ncbi:conserved hypothetical protein [Culex quinquefasciatus]|uniref:Uncharacterized protein n=1 Tax=Culex quinquefasciatus TaxID=7176 RepID=B0XLI0_CULQU|nr:conserved hypothetical protein [Culex quinquefasciatus]|eukprot:XP_001870502.1 conserved hypothetical protein [Culex quinquefasciatus]